MVSAPSGPPPTPELNTHGPTTGDTTNKQSQKNCSKHYKRATVDSVEELDLAFTKRELASAQTRIVQLDAEILDKDKRIKVLLETVKAYEETETKRSYDTYFPRASTAPREQTRCTHAPPTVGCHSACMYNQCNQSYSHLCCSSSAHRITYSCNANIRTAPKYGFAWD